VSEPPPNASWRFEFTAKALRDLRHLDTGTRERLIAAIDGLAEIPLRGDVRKLRGTTDEWRLRVGDWRVRYERDTTKRIIRVLQVLPRGRAYRD
jgi:mRNA interferase RelE/StbE